MAISSGFAGKETREPSCPATLPKGPGSLPREARRAATQEGFAVLEKKIRACLRARRVPEGGLAGDGLGGALRQKARVRGRDGIEHLPSRALRLFSEGPEGVLLGGAKPGQEHDAAL